MGIRILSSLSVFGYLPTMVAACRGLHLPHDLYLPVFWIFSACEVFACGVNRIRACFSFARVGVEDIHFHTILQYGQIFFYLLFYSAIGLLQFAFDLEYVPLRIPLSTPRIGFDTMCTVGLNGIDIYALLEV